MSGVRAVIAPTFTFVGDDESSLIVAEVAVASTALTRAGLIWAVAVAPVIHG